MKHTFFIGSTLLTGFSTFIAINAALKGGPSDPATMGAIAVMGGLISIRAAMKEVTERAKPQAPESSPTTHKDARPAP